MGHPDGCAYHIRFDAGLHSLIRIVKHNQKQDARAHGVRCTVLQGTVLFCDYLTGVVRSVVLGLPVLFNCGVATVHHRSVFRRQKSWCFDGRAMASWGLRLLRQVIAHQCWGWRRVLAVTGPVAVEQ